MGTFIVILLIGTIMAIVHAINNGDAHNRKNIPKNIPKNNSPTAQYTSIFYKRDFFFRSAKEREFYSLLNKALSDTSHTIFAQVRLADLIKTDASDHYSKNLYIKTLSYHVDFLICSGGTFQIVLAIELDSPHHNSIEQQERDLFKSKVLADAKIPLLRFRVEEELTPAILRARLAESLKIPA